VRRRPRTSLAASPLGVVGAATRACVQPGRRRPSAGRHRPDHTARLGIRSSRPWHTKTLPSPTRPRVRPVRALVRAAPAGGDDQCPASRSREHAYSTVTRTLRYVAQPDHAHDRPGVIERATWAAVRRGLTTMAGLSSAHHALTPVIGMPATAGPDRSRVRVGSECRVQGPDYVSNVPVRCAFEGAR
jgi:hypothetical protein